MTLNVIAEFKQVAILNTLRRCALFAELPSQDLNAIASITVPKFLGRGEYLFLENAPMDGFYVVQTGAIKLHRLNLKGHEQVFHVFRPMETIGEEMILSEAGYPADATATEVSQVLLVQKREFLALLRTQRELAFCLLRSAGQRVGSLMRLLEDLTLKDASTRVVGWLLEHCPEPDSDEPRRVDIEMTKHLLAQELGLASETFSRTLNKLRTEHLIDVKGRSVVLLCPVRLREYLRRRNGFPADGYTNASERLAVNC